ncbi:MAG: serine/threonine-protein kinase [Cyanobacteria bacterium J06623_7]
MKGKVLGSRYRVTEYLAEGGFGRTYLAEDTQLPNRDLCVVKQLSPSFNAPKLLAVARRLFETEAKTLHSLGHHPQIPELRAYFEEAGKFYLVQQYIQGQTLDAELARGQIWPANKVIELLRDCLNILQFIHAQGVIHRDIKPANLIRRHGDRQIVVVDFGTVKEILQGQTSLPQLTVAVGTQGYMPIEQARGKPRSSSDLYALGMVGIQALTGVNPLDLSEDSDGELLWSHLIHNQPQLVTILTKMTRYHYGDRYKSAQSILVALNGCADTVINLSQPTSSPRQNVSQNSNSIKANKKAAPTRHLGTSRTTEQSTGIAHQLARQPKPPDSNALPGVRPVALIQGSTRRRVKSSLTYKHYGKIALIVIVVATGVYLLVPKTSNEPNLNPSQIAPSSRS